MSIGMIGETVPPSIISTWETESLIGQNLTQAGIRQITRAMRAEYVIRLQALAYEDAKTGVCRQGGHLSVLKKTQWERCGAAGQAKAVSAAVSTLNKGSRCWKPGQYGPAIWSVPQCQSGGGGLSAAVFGGNAGCFLCAGHYLLFLCHGENRPVLCSGVCGAWIPACVVSAPAVGTGLAGRVADSAAGPGFGVGSFILCQVQC